MATATLPESTRALYPFESHFITLSDGQRMHYVDEGPPDGRVLVFAHGYPLWSFVYRAFVIYFAAQGYRCIAVDHIGYGLSDKPTSRRYHTLRRHIHNLMECLAHLEVRDVTLVMEDWGGPIGLGYAVRHAANVRRLVVMNSWAFQDTLANPLPPLARLAVRRGLGELIFGTLNVGLHLLVQRWTVRTLSEAVLAAYQAPFREARSRTALIQFPRMISASPHHPSAASMREIEHGLPLFEHTPSLLLWGAQNPVFSFEVAGHWKTLLPLASGPHFVEGAGHVLPEDRPEAVVEHLDAFLAEQAIGD
jgi:haloalkane dehalogenase